MTTEKLQSQLQHDDWTQRVAALEDLRAILDHTMDPTSERALLKHVLACTWDRKWEVRKASAVALASFRELDIQAMHRLAELAQDPNRWVRRAAQVSRVFLENRPSWPLAVGAEDPTLHLVAERIRQIGLRSMTPAAILELVSEIGHQYYCELAAETAHEIRTLLTPIEGHLSVLKLEGASSDQGQHHLSNALARLRLLTTLVDDLKAYSAPGCGDVVAVRLDTIVTEALEIGTSSSVETSVTLSPGIQVCGGRSSLVRAFANIIRNACQAMTEGGRLTVDDKCTHQQVTVAVRDTGRGMTDDQIVQSLRRFATTRRSEGGTGLGLPIAERIIVHHHGSLAVESRVGVGTTVLVTLPRIEDRG